MGIIRQVKNKLLEYGAVRAFAKANRERTFEKRWMEQLSSMNGSGYYNQDMDTFFVTNVEEQLFGMTGTINIPDGLAVSDFLTIKPRLEEPLGCLVIPKHDRFNARIDVTIVNRKPEFSFTPYKCEPECIMVGYDVFGKPYFLDLTKSTPHLLIGGASGTGKSFICYMVVANLIYSWDEIDNNFDIILLQIMKAELSTFSECSPCQKYGMIKDVEKVSDALGAIMELAKDRAEFLENSNVRTHNSMHKNPNHKINPLYILIDELAFFMPSPSDTGDMKTLKQKCIQFLVKISQAGRSAGVHIIALVQRATAKNIDPNMKSNFARLTAMQNSIIDSECIIDCTDATKLLDREVLLKSGPLMKMLYIPTLKEDCSDLKKYVPKMKVATMKTEEENKEIDLMYDNFSMYMNGLNINGCSRGQKKVKTPKVLPNTIGANKVLGALDTPQDLADLINGATDGTGVEIVDGDMVVVERQPISTVDIKASGFKKTPNDNIILKFVEDYGIITTGCAEATRNTTSKRVGERLKSLKDAGYLGSYVLHDLYKGHHHTGEKVYYDVREVPNPKTTYHNYLIVNIYSMLWKSGWTIGEFQKEKRLYYNEVDMKKYIIPDATISISCPGRKSVNIFYEADYTHMTETPKMQKYEEYAKLGHKFIVVIAVKTLDDKGNKLNIQIPTSTLFPVLKENFRLDLSLKDYLDKQ